MLAQPLIEGVGEGVFGLATEQGVVCWSGHRRVRMMNPSGSGASACESLSPAQDTREIAEKFVSSIGWRGIFMIELLRDQDGNLWFMELNGRSWGSMALARRRGFEYPAWAVRNLLDPGFVPEEPSPSGRVVCRHLGREILHPLFVLRGPRGGHRANWPGFGKSLLDVLRIRAGERWYNDNPADRALFWVDAWRTITTALPGSGAAPRLLGRLFQRAQRPFVRRRQAALRARGAVVPGLHKGTKVLFLCYGNINRSALAEQYLRRLLGDDVSVSSCGFHGIEGRPLDPNMQRVAGECGVTLEPWSSKAISRRLVAAADIILAMEAAHLVRLREEYPEVQGRSFLLSCVTRPGTIPLEVEDPYGKPDLAYKRCLEEIVLATTAVAERLR